MNIYLVTTYLSVLIIYLSIFFCNKFIYLYLSVYLSNYQPLQPPHLSPSFSTCFSRFLPIYLLLLLPYHPYLHVPTSLPFHLRTLLPPFSTHLPPFPTCLPDPPVYPALPACPSRRVLPPLSLLARKAYL